jgi:hypothetical protein
MALMRCSKMHRTWMARNEMPIGPIHPAVLQSKTPGSSPGVLREMRWSQDG